MKIKVGDILHEDCGCSYTVIRINKKSYRLKHISGDELSWDKKDLENWMKKGSLSKKPFKKQ